MKQKYKETPLKPTLGRRALGTIVEAPLAIAATALVVVHLIRYWLTGRKEKP